MKDCILIVEDEPAIADTLQYTLETEGFDTELADSGGPVPGILAEKEIALILLDIGLPDINGFELCKQIREIADMPIIFLTARSDEIDRVVGLEIGGDDYVTKPFSPREVSARVKAVLRRARRPGIDSASGLTGTAGLTAEPVATAAFRIEMDRRRIFWHGVELTLSRYEFNLLAVFIAAPGRVFSRDSLMEKAWDEPDASMDRTVDAHIKNIRAKLREVRPDEDPVRTHRGVGYSLKEECA